MTQKRTDTENSSADYEVGKGKPPIEHQYKPGQSGNPKGRSKGTKNLKTDLAEELAERVSVTENGKPITLSKQRVMLKALTSKAMKGDTRAVNTLISLIAQTVGLDPHEERPTSLSDEDSAILADWLNRNSAEDTSNTKPDIKAREAEVVGENEGDDDDWLK